MPTTYTIGETARRSGFTPATLRYYDDLGLVTPDRRSDDRDLDRLRFIGRGKQLGCSSRAAPIVGVLATIGLTTLAVALGRPPDR